MNAGTLTINSGTINNDDPHDGAQCVWGSPGSTTTINGGSMKYTGENVHSEVIDIEANGKCYIYGGTFINSTTGIGSSTSNVNVGGRAIICDGYLEIQSRKSSITIQNSSKWNSAYRAATILVGVAGGCNISSGNNPLKISNSNSKYSFVKLKADLGNETQDVRRKITVDIDNNYCKTNGTISY